MRRVLFTLRTLLSALFLLLAALQETSQVLGKTSQASSFSARINNAFTRKLFVVVLITIRVLKRRSRMASSLVTQSNDLLTNKVEHFKVLRILEVNTLAQSHTVVAITQISDVEALLTRKVVVQSVDMLVASLSSKDNKLQLTRRASLTRIFISLIKEIYTERFEARRKLELLFLASRQLHIGECDNGLFFTIFNLLVLENFSNDGLEWSDSW